DRHVVRLVRPQDLEVGGRIHGIGSAVRTDVVADLEVALHRVSDRECLRNAGTDRDVPEREILGGHREGLGPQAARKDQQQESDALHCRALPRGASIPGASGPLDSEGTKKIRGSAVAASSRNSGSSDGAFSRKAEFPRSRYRPEMLQL